MKVNIKFLVGEGFCDLLYLSMDQCYLPEDFQPIIIRKTATTTSQIIFFIIIDQSHLPKVIQSTVSKTRFIKRFMSQCHLPEELHPISI